MIDVDALPTAEDLARTRALLARRQARQERLRAELDATGLTGFSERMAWLFERRTADEKTAWRRRWAALGLTEIDPRPPAREPVKLHPTKPCERCGVLRVINEAKARVSPLCRDCRFVMTKEEIALWAA